MGNRSDAPNAFAPDEWVTAEARRTVEGKELVTTTTRRTPESAAAQARWALERQLQCITSWSSDETLQESIAGLICYLGLAAQGPQQLTQLLGFEAKAARGWANVRRRRLGQLSAITVDNARIIADAIDSGSRSSCRAAIKIIQTARELEGERGQQHARGEAGETCSHSPDYASCRWYGREFKFTKKQARIVGILWRCWEQGTSSVNEETIADELDPAGTNEAARSTRGSSDSDRYESVRVSFRLADTMRSKEKRRGRWYNKRHPAMGVMIHRAGKGQWRLDRPPK